MVTLVSPNLQCSDHSLIHLPDNALIISISDTTQTFTSGLGDHWDKGEGGRNDLMLQVDSF